MPAYLIALIDVSDPQAYREYTLHTPRVIGQFGGRMVVRNGERVVLEGPAEPRRVVVIEFPTLADAVRFHGSEAYAPLRQMRAPASEAQIFAIDGFPAEAWDQALAESRERTL